MHTSTVIGIFCFLALWLCWSTFSMMTAYVRVKAASTLTNGSPLLFWMQTKFWYIWHGHYMDYKNLMGYLVMKLVIRTCQWSEKCSIRYDMTGASPGSRKASRYILSASSTRASSKLNALKEERDVIGFTFAVFKVCFQYANSVVNKSCIYYFKNLHTFRSLNRYSTCTLYELYVCHSNSIKL